MISEPKWLSSKSVRVMQEILIARTGGTPRILNPTLLESTIDKMIVIESNLINFYKVAWPFP